MESYDDNELYHHGVLGMKWGVRRYQNKDGSLTPKGLARFDEVSSKPNLAERQTRIAKKIYSKNRKEYDALADLMDRKSKKAHSDADKLVWKSEAKQMKGDQVGFNKYQGKAWKKIAESTMADKAKNIYQNQSALLSKKIKDLDNGTIKAGRDFIVQTDIDAIVLPGLAYVNVARKVIEK